jgi:hypothetical protein
MKLRLAILFFLIILPGFSISQNIDSLKVQKWLEDNTIYEGCENRIDSLKAETNGLRILMNQYLIEIDSLNNFNSQLSSSMNEVQLDKIVISIMRQYNSEIYVEPQSGIFIEETEEQSQNWIFIPENKSYIISSEELSICSCLEKTRSMSYSKILKYLNKKRIQNKIEKSINTLSTANIIKHPNSLSKAISLDSFFPRSEYLFTKQSCLRIVIFDSDEYQVTIFMKEIKR